MVEARRPCGVVGLVVLRSEWFEHEIIRFEARGRVFPHEAKLTPFGFRDAGRQEVTNSAPQVDHASTLEAVFDRAGRNRHAVTDPTNATADTTRQAVPNPLMNESLTAFTTRGCTWMGLFCATA